MTANPLLVAVRQFLDDFRTGTYSDWQESLEVLRVLARQTPDETTAANTNVDSAQCGAEKTDGERK